MNVFPGSTCPMRNLKCEASDVSNVITTTTTSDDAECGGRFIISSAVKIIIKPLGPLTGPSFPLISKCQNFSVNF